jgi:hypothetical protein
VESLVTIMGVVPEAIVYLKKGKTIAFSQDRPCNAARHGNHPDPVLHAFREAFREVMRIDIASNSQKLKYMIPSIHDCTKDRDYDEKIERMHHQVAG